MIVIIIIVKDRLHFIILHSYPVAPDGGWWDDVLHRTSGVPDWLKTVISVYTSTDATSFHESSPVVYISTYVTETTLHGKSLDLYSSACCCLRSFFSLPSDQISILAPAHPPHLIPFSTASFSPTCLLTLLFLGQHEQRFESRFHRHGVEHFKVCIHYSWMYSLFMDVFIIHGGPFLLCVRVCLTSCWKIRTCCSKTITMTTSQSQAPLTKKAKV